MLSPSWSPALADTGSPELSPPLAASPLPSLPSTLAPPPTEVVLPPANSAASSVLSPPSPPADVTPPLTSSPRPAAMVPSLSSLSPPAAVVPPLTSPPPPVAVVPPVVSLPTPVAVMPPLTSPPPPTADKATPPFASSQPRPRTPALLTPPSQLPTPLLVPATPPESSMLPGTSPPPLATPLMPTISPPSPLASSSPLVIGPPPPGAAARTLPRTPTPFFTSLPTQPPPPLPVVEIPGSPAGSLQSPPLSLPLVNLPPNLPAKEPSHVYMGLVFGVVIGGVLLLVLLALLFICYRATSRTPDKDVSCGPHSLRADNLFDVLHQHSQENVEQAGAHVIVAPPKHLLPLPCTKNNGSGIFNYSGSMNPIPTHTVDVSLSLSRGPFTYDELVAATNGFSAANLLGEGGFGYVHKGVLANGKEVAVKQLKTGSHQGEREFQAEVEVISTVHHKHLVTLVGYCITGVQRLLVYEFVPNNTLEFHLHGKERPTLEWETRLKIAIGSARGLAYLHEDCNPTIIHRDIKAANILLDSKFEAKVSDFGLAKFFSATNTPITHISTRVVGTFGYLAPEYASSGKLTDKSDVYSYGVMLLELITGCLPIITRNESLMNESLVNWARPLLAKALKDENFDALVDPKLQSQYNPTEMASMVACAAACVRHSAWLRPRMSQVVRALEGDVPLPRFDGVMPGCSTLYSSSESSTYNAHQYGNHLKRFNMILANEHGFSGCSGTTSEYGLHPSISSSEFQ